MTTGLAQLDMNRGSALGDQYVWALQAAYDSGVRLFDPSLALRRDANIGEKIRRDPIIKNALDVRQHKIAGRKFTVEPRSDREVDKVAAEVVETLISEVGDMSMARYRLANAIADSRAFAWITGRREVIPAGPDPGITADWWIPTKLKDVDERRFRWGLKDPGQGVFPRQAVLELWGLKQRKWVELTDADLRQIVQVVYDDTEGRLGYGRGLRDAIYHFHWAKGVVLREGLAGLERWAQQWPVIKIDTSQAGDTTQTSTQIREDYLDVFKKHRARFGAVAIDKEDEVEWAKTQGGGHQMVESFLNYLDSAMTRLITGSLLPTGGGAQDKGSLARAREEGDTSEMLVQFDRAVLDEALTRDLIYLIWIMNREQFAANGLGDARQPRFKTINEKKEDTKVTAETAATLLQAGVPLKAEEVYQRTGFTMPSDDDEIIEPMQAVDPLGGLGGGFKR